MKLLLFLMLTTGCATIPALKRPEVAQCRPACGLSGVAELNVSVDDSQAILSCKCKQ